MAFSRKAGIFMGELLVSLREGKSSVFLLGPLHMKTVDAIIDAVRAFEKNPSNATTQNLRLVG